MPLNQLETQVLQSIEPKALLSTLQGLVAIKSLGGQEAPAQEYVAEFMSSLGMDVDVWHLDLDELEQHPAFSMEIDRPGALGVVGSLGAGNPALILNGHVDVVPVGDERAWTHDPWAATQVGGRVYGRGTCDMKGGLACALHAAKALLSSGVSLRQRLLLESVVGEEDGGVGTLAAIERGYRADAAIVVEPTSGVVAPAQAAALSFRVSLQGLAAHGCIREEGVSAIEKFFPIHRALLDLERRRNRDVPGSLYQRFRLPFALCIGRVEAGDWASNEADWLVFQGRYGVGPDEELGAARRQFEQAVREAAQADPWLRDHLPRVEWWGAQWLPGSIPTGHPLVGMVAEAVADVRGEATLIEGLTYGADMGLLVNVGQTPTILFGPGDIRQAHVTDEFVQLDELLQAAQVLALVALRACG